MGPIKAEGRLDISEYPYLSTSLYTDTWTFLDISYVPTETVYYTYEGPYTTYTNAQYTRERTDYYDSYTYYTETATYTELSYVPVARTDWWGAVEDYGKRSLPTDAPEPSASRGKEMAPGPTPMPSPPPAPTTAPLRADASDASTPRLPRRNGQGGQERLQKGSAARRSGDVERAPRQLVKRRRGGGGGYGGGGDGMSEEDKYKAGVWHAPSFLGVIWSGVVLLWLLALLCVGSRGRLRSVALMRETLMWLSLGGLVSTVYVVAVLIYVAAKNSYVTGLTICTAFFGGLLTIALIAVWLWLRRWSKHLTAEEQQHSVASIEAGDTGTTNYSPVAVGSDPKLDAVATPLQLPYAGYPGDPTPSSTPAPGPHNSQSVAQPQLYQGQQAYAQPANLPALPTGYAYAVVPVAAPGPAGAPHGAPSSPNLAPTSPLSVASSLYQPQPQSAPAQPHSYAPQQPHAPHGYPYQ